ncbi:MAG: transketolase C-terminal domain-containing protein, partial [Pseudomonadota bacterium]
AAEIQDLRRNLGWDYAPFELPPAICHAWAAAGARHHDTRKAWQQRLVTSRRRKAFEAAQAGQVSQKLERSLSRLRRNMVKEKVNIATRKASFMALEAINSATDLTVGGSADLTGSNLTMTPGMKVVQPGRFRARYIHYGVREHAMAAVMNGLALHGGMIPYGGSFLVFSDYARGAIRLSAMMGLQVIYVLTHDSIGVGEDGPTHQPIEHLALLRAIPNLNLFRPADPVEVAECYQIALRDRRKPSVLVLSRQNVPLIRQNPAGDCSSRGAYLLRPAPKKRDLTLLATGSEVALAFAAAEKLAGFGVKAAIVSMPCWELFEAESTAYRTQILGDAPRIAIEAAGRMGWDRWIGTDGVFIGMDSFGASAPAHELYEHFKITVPAIVAQSLECLGYGQESSLQ